MSFTDCLLNRVWDPTFADMICTMYETGLLPFWSEKNTDYRILNGFLDKIDKPVLDIMYNSYTSKKLENRFYFDFTTYYTARERKANIIMMIKTITGVELKDPHTNLMDMCAYVDQYRFCTIVYYCFIYRFVDWDPSTIKQFLQKIGNDLTTQLIRYGKEKQKDAMFDRVYLTATPEQEKKFVDDLVENNPFAVVEPVKECKYNFICGKEIRKLNDLVQFRNDANFASFVVDCMMNGLDDWNNIDENFEPLVKFLKEIGQPLTCSIITLLSYKFLDRNYKNIFKRNPSNASNFSYIYHTILAYNPFENLEVKDKNQSTPQYSFAVDTSTGIYNTGSETPQSSAFTVDSTGRLQSADASEVETLRKENAELKEKLAKIKGISNEAKVHFSK